MYNKENKKKRMECSYTKEFYTLGEKEHTKLPIQVKTAHGKF